MDSRRARELVEALRRELAEAPARSQDILEEWADRYREEPDAGPILREIGRIQLEGDEYEPPQAEEMRLRLEQTLADARAGMAQGRLTEAAELLAEAAEEIENFSLTEESLWMDFHSHLDGLLFQDYFSEEIDGREVRRHPLHPARLLYTYGGILLDLDRAAEAVPVLEQLAALDPVCPLYLAELCDAYKRTGNYEDAWDTALFALSCVSTREEAARCYRDLGYCLCDKECYDDAALLYQQSLYLEKSPLAVRELAWMTEQTGRLPRRYTEEERLRRLQELGIPVGFSDAVRENVHLLAQFLSGEADPYETSD